MQKKKIENKDKKTESTFPETQQRNLKILFKYYFC